GASNAARGLGILDGPPEATDRSGQPRRPSRARQAELRDRRRAGREPVGTVEVATRAAPFPLIPTHRIAGERRDWTSWITTTDHKRIGILYLATCMVFFLVGGVEALLMRSQLAIPENTLINAEHYNQLV